MAGVGGGSLGVALIAAGNAGVTLGILAAGGILTPLAFASQSLRWRLFLMLIAALVVWSFGFNNVGVPLPGGMGRVPLVDVLLVAYLIAFGPAAWRCLNEAGARALGVLLIALVVYVGVRIILDWPHTKLLAGRDGVFALYASMFAIAHLCGTACGHHKIRSVLTRIFAVSLLWFCLFPIRSAVEQLGPTVGIQRPEALFAFTSMGTIGAVAMLWFLVAQKHLHYLAVSLGTFAVVMAQLRTLYIAVPLAVSVAIIWPGHKIQEGQHRDIRTRAMLTLGVAAAVLIVLLPLSPALPGRVGAVDAGILFEQVGTLLGEEGVGKGSISDRRDWWSNSWQLFTKDPTTILFGIGLGYDLTGGFHRGEGVIVRTPHNDWLEIVTRTGLIGFSLWAAILVLVVRHVRRATRVADASLWNWYRSGLIVWLLLASTQPTFFFAYGGFVFFATSGLIAGGATNMLRPALSERATRRQPTRLLVRHLEA